MFFMTYSNTCKVFCKTSNYQLGIAFLIFNATSMRQLGCCTYIAGMRDNHLSQKTENEAEFPALVFKENETSVSHINLHGRFRTYRL